MPVGIPSALHGTFHGLYLSDDSLLVTVRIGDIFHHLSDISLSFTHHSVWIRDLQKNDTCNSFIDGDIDNRTTKMKGGHIISLKEYVGEILACNKNINLSK